MFTIKRIKKTNICITIFLIFLPFIIHSCFNLTSVKVIADENREKLEEIEYRWNETGEIKNIINNKVFVIGDSRMEYLSDRGKQIEIPTNFSFIALGGTKIDWFSNNAVPSLKEKLESMQDNIKYHVIVNMGVNDLNDYNDPLIHSENYFKLYYDLASQYEDVNFYILSINPVDMSIINKRIYNQKRTNIKIEKFNKNIIHNIKNSNLKNIKYCDSYNNINFKTRDGLHYDKQTDQYIINYLTKNCLEYE